MSLTRLAGVSLFLGLWTPALALVIVWMTAGSGTPIIYALEGVGVDQFDRPAIALAFAPPLPFLVALVALGLGLGAQQLSDKVTLAPRARRVVIQSWLAAGLVLSGAAPLSLYAEHATAHEPIDEVHLLLWIATWAWWSLTVTTVAVALALRSHARLGSWASRSRAVAGASLGIGVLSLSAASVGMSPRPLRARVDEWVPVIDVVATETESLVLSLSGTSMSSGSSFTTPQAGGSDEGGDTQPSSDHYTFEECIEELVGVRVGRPAVANVVANLERRYSGLDAEDVTMESALDICLDEPRRGGGRLEAMLQDAAGKRAISRLRRRSTAERNESGVMALFGGAADEANRAELRSALRCLLAGLEEPERKLVMAELLGEDIVAFRESSLGAAQRASRRAKELVRERKALCGIHDWL